MAGMGRHVETKLTEAAGMGATGPEFRHRSIHGIGAALFPGGIGDAESELPDLEEVSKMMSEIMKDRTPEEIIRSHYTNLDVLRKQHLERLKAFNAVYKWKSVSGTSIADVFSDGSHIVLNASNTVDIKTLAQSPGEVFKDKYIFCRTVTLPLKMFAVHAVVMDAKHSACRLVITGVQSLFPFHPNIIPVGSILVIKNPAVHCTADTDLGYSLLVLDKASIFYLRHVDFSWMNLAGVTGCGTCHCTCRREAVKSWTYSDLPATAYGYPAKSTCENLFPVPTSAREWKRAAEKFVETGDSVNGVQAYTRALSFTPKDIKVLQARCVAFSSLNLFELAMNDAEEILSLDPKNATGVHLKAQCLLGLRRYQDAVNFLKTKMKKLNSHDDGITETLNVALEMLEQQKYGKYDMIKVMMKMTQRMEMADYAGPLEYRLDPKTGKKIGVVATKKIVRGTLVLVKKALVSAVSDDTSIWPAGHVLFNEVISRAILIHNIEYMLNHQPDKAQEYYSLLETEPTKPETRNFLDVERMCEVMYRKAFVAMDGFQPSATLQNTGIFTGFASSLRHRCVDANCSWQLFGDYLMVRAYKDIEKDEELFITRVDPKLPFELRRFKIEEMGINCFCRLCKCDITESSEVRKKRLALLSSLRDTLTSCVQELSVKKLDAQLKQYVSLRIDHPDLNTRLYSAIETIAMAYFYKGDVQKSIKFMEWIRPLIFKSGCSLEFVACTTGLITCYEHLGNRKKAQEYTDMLNKELELYLGKPGDKLHEIMLSNRHSKKVKFISVPIGIAAATGIYS